MKSDAERRSSLRFDALDDLAFQSLLNEHLLQAGNALAHVLPSTLDLSANCWTTSDLQYLTYSASHIDELSRVRYIANALHPALPTSTFAGPVDSFEYWRAVTRLNSTQDVLESTLTECYRSKDFGLPMMNFEANCSATTTFWHNVYNIETASLSTVGLDPSWFWLFRSSLPGHYQDLSPATMKKMIDTIQINPWEEPYHALPEPLSTSFEAALPKCALPACRALRYSGNSDISGIGAVIAYASIAAVSTFLAVTLTYFYSRPSRGHDHWRRRTIQAAVIFWDTIIWFGVLALIALFVFVVRYTQTLYEYVLSILVAYLIFNANCILLVLDSKRLELLDKFDYDYRRLIPQVVLGIGIYFLILVTLQDQPAITVSTANTIEWWSHDFVDMPCYANDMWPLYYLKTATKLQVVQLCSPSILMLWLACDSWIAAVPCVRDSRPIAWLRSRSKKWEAFWPYPIVLFTSAILWVDFWFIVRVRERGRHDFGISYQENSFGFGQIVSAGISAQAIYALCCTGFLFLWKNLKKRWRNRQSDEENQANSTAIVAQAKPDGQESEVDETLLPCPIPGSDEHVKESSCNHFYAVSVSELHTNAGRERFGPPQRSSTA